MKMKAFIISLAILPMLFTGCGNNDSAQNAQITYEKASEAMLDFYLECKEAEKNGETVEIMVDGVNRYNTLGFSNVSEMTIAEEAEEAKMPMDIYRETYNIPENMPDDTFIEVAFCLQPVSVVAVNYEMTYEEFKEYYSVPEYVIRESGEKIPITEDMPWGIVRDELTVQGLHINPEDLKRAYGFGEEVTETTKWKEIRPTIEKKQQEITKENMENEVENNG